MELDDDGTPVLRDPDGERLGHAVQLTCRDARSWVRRSGTLLGVQHCSSPVQWALGDDRAGVVDHIRRAEGADCDTAGDTRLYQLVDGRRAVVLVVE